MGPGVSVAVSVANQFRGQNHAFTYIALPWPHPVEPVSMHYVLVAELFNLVGRGLGGGCQPTGELGEDLHG